MALVARALRARSSAGGGPRPRDVVPSELPPAGDDRPAAVLCLLFEQEGQASVLLTRRSRHLRTHAGEVSFPGGRLRSGEPALAAALREAQEEVGLRPEWVEVIGELTPLTTRRSPALVRCFVGRTDVADVLAELVPNAEVERLFWVRLAQLAAPGVFHEELWPPYEGASPEQYQAVPFFELGQELVWGATARLLAELLELCLEPASRRAAEEGTLEGS